MAGSVTDGIDADDKCVEWRRGTKSLGAGTRDGNGDGALFLFLIFDNEAKCTNGWGDTTKALAYWAPRRILDVKTSRTSADCRCFVGLNTMIVMVSWLTLVDWWLRALLCIVAERRQKTFTF